LQASDSFLTKKLPHRRWCELEFLRPAKSVTYTPWSISFVTDVLVMYTRYKPLYVGFKI
jgi:hypothetical protein